MLKSIDCQILNQLLQAPAHGPKGLRLISSSRLPARVPCIPFIEFVGRVNALRCHVNRQTQPGSAEITQLIEQRLRAVSVASQWAAASDTCPPAFNAARHDAVMQSHRAHERHNVHPYARSGAIGLRAKVVHASGVPGHFASERTLSRRIDWAPAWIDAHTLSHHLFCVSAMR
ncbi:MAG: hypothetical protein CPSOU_2281 [uncultured Paraburkholderia sp.]|nr:MAG: hypothetical protein CPSOU_2281 [uncultured Paraburkholderia sp.]